MFALTARLLRSLRASPGARATNSLRSAPTRRDSAAYGHPSRVPDHSGENEMAEHPNATLVKKGFAAFDAGDMAALNTLFTDDIVWHGAGRSFLGGDFAGKGAVLGVFARLTQEADSFQQKVHAVLADDEHAVALVEATATRDDKKASMQQVFVFHISGGKIREAWVSLHDVYAADEFWA